MIRVINLLATARKRPSLAKFKQGPLIIMLGTILAASLWAVLWLSPAARAPATIAAHRERPQGLAPPALSSSELKHLHAGAAPPKSKPRRRSETELEPPYGHLSKQVIDENLAAIKLAGDGSLVLSKRHKQQLEAAFKRMDYTMSAAQVRNLQKYIQRSLGGETGKKVADIVGNYYDFKLAERDIIGQMGSSGIDALLDNFHQIVQARIAYLGPEINEQLFGGEQRKEQYMIESMLLQNNPSLDEKERARQQQELREHFQLGAY